MSNDDASDNASISETQVDSRNDLLASSVTRTGGVAALLAALMRTGRRNEVARAACADRGACAQRPEA